MSSMSSPAVRTTSSPTRRNAGKATLSCKPIGEAVSDQRPNLAGRRPNLAQAEKSQRPSPDVQNRNFLHVSEFRRMLIDDR